MDVAVYEEVQPARAAEFTQSLGVNIHVRYLDTIYGDLPGLIGSLDHLKVHRVREALPRYYQDRIHTLAAHGVDFTFVVSEITPEESIGVMRPFVDYISAIEGPNEVNFWPVTYEGMTGMEGAAAYQRAIYASVKGDPAFAEKPVYALTLGGVGPDAYPPLGDLSEAADFGNAHIYFPQGSPPGEVIYSVDDWLFQPTPGLPRVITETGYYTEPRLQDGVSESVQARYTLNLWLSYFASGVQRIYLYELFDQKPDPDGTDRERHFGLFRNDGSAKPAADAIRNMMSITEDFGASSATFAPAPLSYSIENLPATGNTVLLQKSGGEHLVVIWSEPRIWDPEAKAEIDIPPTPVTLRLGATFRSAAVYDPMIGTTPIRTATGTDSVTVEITDHPVVVEIETELTDGLQRATTEAGGSVTQSAARILDGASGCCPLYQLYGWNFGGAELCEDQRGRCSGPYMFRPEQSRN